MTTIGREIAAQRAHIWKELGIEATVPFPSFPGSLLYGDLSAAVHLPTYRSLIIEDHQPKDFRDFFLYLAQQYRARVEEVDEEAAAFGEQLNRRGRWLPKGRRQSAVNVADYCKRC